MVPFPQRLREARKRKQFTQKEVAEHLEIKLRSYQQYEGGQRRPDYETLVKIADHLDVTTDYLLGRTDAPRVEGERVIPAAPSNEAGREMS